MNNKGKILIIDDNPKNIQLLANVLSENDYEIEIGLSGQEALEWFQDETFDLLMLDIMMPEINGYEVCKKIRLDHRHDTMPIIFISAKSDSQSMVQGFEVGGQDYISKPFDSAELLARVKTHIELKNSKEELKNNNLNLENKVKERTLELHKANEELTLITKTKDKYLSFIGKEVSTPLKSINKVVEVIKHSAESTRLAEMITLLDLSVEKLEQITQMAKHITQINSNSKTDEIKEFGLLNSIEYVLTNMNNKLDEKDVAITINIDEQLRIKGNKELIRNSIVGVIDTIINHFDNQQTLKIDSYKTDNSHELVLESEMKKWTDYDLTSLPEESLLSFSYAETIMAFQGGEFIIDNSKSPNFIFKWVFKL